jgi:hypothetical protein
MNVGQYRIKSYWGPRDQTTEAIADHCLRMLDALVMIDPVFSRWFFDGRGDQERPVGEITRVLPALINGCANEEPGDGSGYRFSFSNSGYRHARYIDILVSAGCRWSEPWLINSVGLATIEQTFSPTDPQIVTLDIFRAALLAIARIWRVTWCAAYPTDLMRFWPKAGKQHFKPAWMTYVSPRFAPLIVPTRAFETQRLTEGGILMVATRERFDVANAAHLAAAQVIDAAIAPLNALPWPPDT